jgi:hypothetical protein
MKLDLFEVPYRQRALQTAPLPAQGSLFSAIQQRGGDVKSLQCSFDNVEI